MANSNKNKAIESHKSISYRGHRWSEVLHQNNPHMKKAGYDVILRRTPSQSEMRHSRGGVPSGIDAKFSELQVRHKHLKSEHIKPYYRN